MTYQLYPQQAHAEPLLTGGSGVLWWEVRVGKTRAVYHAYNALANRGKIRDAVVVAPSTIRAVHKEEADAMGLDLPFIDLSGITPKTRRATIGEGRRRREFDPATWPAWMPRIYLLNPELLPAWTAWLQANLEAERFVLVADESHMYLRNASGTQTARYKAFEALAAGTDHVWELSGTWMAKSALDVYWQLRPFGPAGDPFYYTRKACYDRFKPCKRCFACRYCNMTYNQFATTGVSYEGVKNEDDLFARLPNVSVIREEDVREVALSDRFPVWVGEGDEDWDPDVDLGDVEIDRLQRTLVPKKIELARVYLAQLREGEVGPNEPVVIFGWHREFTEGLAKLLDCPVITGDTSPAARTRIRHEFATGKVPVLVGNLQSMGMGIDLAAARWFIHGEPPYRADLAVQAEGRGRGPKQKAKTLRQAYLLIRRSVDETIWKVRLQRGAAIDKMYAAGRRAGHEAGARYREETR